MLNLGQINSVLIFSNFITRNKAIEYKMLMTGQIQFVNKINQSYTSTFFSIFYMSFLEVIKQQ
jgi:hypothetical protein